MISDNLWEMIWVCNTRRYTSNITTTEHLHPHICKINERVASSISNDLQKCNKTHHDISEPLMNSSRRKTTIQVVDKGKSFAQHLFGVLFSPQMYFFHPLKEIDRKKKWSTTTELGNNNKRYLVDLNDPYPTPSKGGWLTDSTVAVSITSSLLICVT